MACSVATVLTSLCTSGIGDVTNERQLLQIIAQLTADELAVVSPGIDVTPTAILARACTSGILLVTNERQLLQIIAQNGCELDS